MNAVRRVVIGALLAAGSLAATGLPASATTMAAAPASTVTVAARCSVSVQKLGTLVLNKAVGTERTRLHTSCALKAPLTLTILPVGAATKLGTIVFRGSGGVVTNNAVGVIHLTARNYKPGRTYRLAPATAQSVAGKLIATAPQKFVVKALGLATFTSKSLDRKHGIIRTVGQEVVFSLTAGRFVAHSGPVVGFVREGSKGTWKRDTSDPKVTFTRAGRTTWNIQVRCGSWEYQMVQPSGRAVTGVAGNILVTTRTC